MSRSIRIIGLSRPRGALESSGLARLIRGQGAPHRVCKENKHG